MASGQREQDFPKTRPTGFHCEWVSGRSVQSEAGEHQLRVGEAHRKLERLGNVSGRALAEEDEDEVTQDGETRDEIEEKYVAHAAARYGEREKLEEVLKPDQVPGALKDKSGFTPLHFASCYGHSECVSYLLEHQADVHTLSVHAWTPLHVAARAGRTDCLKLLLNAGASVDARDQYEWTPLHNAACKGDVGAIAVLLKAGADIDCKDKDGWTALHFAARFNNVEAVELLIKNGASVTVHDVDGWTAVHNCARNGQIRCVQALLESKADVFATNRFGETPLHVAARKGKSKVVAIMSKIATKQGCLDRLRKVQDAAGNTAEDVASTTLLREMLNAEAHHEISWYQNVVSDERAKSATHHTKSSFGKQIGKCAVM